LGAERTVVVTYEQKLNNRNPITISIEPVFHWTDQKIGMHVFCCVLALMRLLLRKRKLQRVSIKLSLEKMIDELSDLLTDYLKSRLWVIERR
jgi:transposase